jgi:dienelactone hydrolase
MRMTRLDVLVLSFSIVIHCAAFSQSAPEPHFMPPPGPYRVGLRISFRYDESRPAAFRIIDKGSAATARRIQTLEWYPAESGGQAITVSDYLRIDDTLPDGEWHTHDLSPDRAKAFASSRSPMLSHLDAPLKNEHFPVIIYSPSMSASAAENADLCEFLASHGYVVLASPSHGRVTKLMTDDVEGLVTQARDILFLIDYAAQQPNTEAASIAVVGYSWGGLANVYAATQDKRIKALVSLDGSIRYYVSVAWEAGIHPEQMTQPLLIFTQGYIPLESDLVNALISKGRTSLISSWSHADMFKVEMAAMDHGAFASMNLRNDGWWEGGQGQGLVLADYERSEAMASYQALATYTQAFLDSRLKQDSAAASFLKEPVTAHGVPKHLMNVSIHPAVGLPSTFEALRSELEKRGFDHAQQILADAVDADATFKVNEKSLLAWGSAELLDQGKTSEATELFKVAVAMFPESSNSYADLGEAYYRAGDKTKAVENFKKALELNRENYFAMDRLKQLR